MITTRHHQAGLSLIELMIALAISSFLILGITQVYIDNQRHHLFQQTQSGNLDNGRFASLIIDQYLGKAGYRRNPVNSIESTFPQLAATGGCREFSTGSSITGLHPDEGLGFCIRYQPQENNELDCQGAASTTTYAKAFPESLTTNQLIVLAFKFEPGTTTELQNGRLLCKNLNASPSQFTEQLTGIADMRIDFGVGEAGMNSKLVTSFIPQSTWTVASGPIRTVRYAMLLTGRKGQRDTADEPAILTQWRAAAPDASKTRLTDGEDRRIYQVAASTRTVRNLMP